LAVGKQLQQQACTRFTNPA